MPYLGNLDQTELAVQDVLRQTVPTTLLLINQGGPRLDISDPRIHHWRHDPPLPSLAATWNRALEAVWAMDERAAWVVNNDVRLPTTTLAQLLEVQNRTPGWFVTACNVGAAYDPDQIVPLADVLTSRGGPDFSCYLITRWCHRWFQFDEGFVPAYHEDNDYHRRLQLAGLGEKIFSVLTPYFHHGSGTLKANPQMVPAWGGKFDACRAYYVRKWGGPPHHETYQVPFQPELGLTEGLGADLRRYMTGQGTPPWTRETEALFNGQAT